MKPFLFVAVFFALAVAACNKKNTAASDVQTATSNWKLTRYVSYGFVSLTYIPPADSPIVLTLGNNHQAEVHDNGKLIAQHGYTIENVTDSVVTYTLADSVLNFDTPSLLRADGSLQLQQKLYMSIKGDSMALSSYFIPPSGLSQYYFVKQPN